MKYSFLLACRFSLAAGLASLFALPSFALDSRVGSPCIQPQRAEATWELSWQDTFNSSGPLDMSKWSFEKGTNIFTDEIEYNTTRPTNVRIEGKQLLVEAHKELYKGSKYTSGKIISRKSQTYGRWEICANVPSGHGTWSAFWLLADKRVYGENFWPDNGEIDFMENIGRWPDTNVLSAHTKNYNFHVQNYVPTYAKVPNLTDHFHLYALDWEPDRLNYYIDNVLVKTVARVSDNWQDWPFSQNFHLIINLAIGGGWANEDGFDEKMFPRKIVIDSVRVYDYRAK